MSAPESSTKVYIEIVKQLRNMIQVEGYQAGDKLPSERELSERLNVGRSSVREAFRALELLGLIETRRGEGTFIRDFRGHNLVQLLSTFILQDDRARTDIKETKYLIEWDCLWLAAKKVSEEELQSFRNWAESTVYTDDEFFYHIILLADNHLFMRMWTILKDYYNSLKFDQERVAKADYIKLVDSLLSYNEQLIKDQYCKIRNLSSI
ncbi:FadR family transcriptional regulator [Bacillus sp. CRN 9]|nr:FadR family transcriptional regulator [Bacillus sp. CRN 9]